MTSEENKKEIYKDIENLHSNHHVKWIKICLKNLDSLPKEQSGLDLLIKLHERLNNPSLRTAIENEIEKYPAELLKNSPVRKVTKDNCTFITEKTEYYCTFHLDKGFFCEEMKKHGSNKDHAELCFMYLLAHIRDKAQEITDIMTHYSCDNELSYKLNSEEKREKIKSTLNSLSKTINYELIFSHLAKCSDEEIPTFFEYYNLQSELKETDINQSNNKKMKI